MTPLTIDFQLQIAVSYFTLAKLMLPRGHSKWGPRKLDKFGDRQGHTTFLKHSQDGMKY